MLISVGAVAGGPCLSGSLGRGSEDSGVMPFALMTLDENERLAVEGMSLDVELSSEF